MINASLKKHFGGVKAVQDVSLDLKAGALQCIIGPNGAGKSTLFNMIAGTLQPTSGSIDFEGNSIIGLPCIAMPAWGSLVNSRRLPSLKA